MLSDASYHCRRANEERRLARAATDPRARWAHLEMAARYDTLAGAEPDDAEVQDAVAQRLFAAAFRRGLEQDPARFRAAAAPDYNNEQDDAYSGCSEALAD